MDADAKAELTATALQLAGRDRIVLTAREGLFRLCEARANGDLGEGDYFKGFQEVMYTVRSMFDAEKAAAVKKLNESSPDAAKILSESFSKPPEK